MNQNRQEAELRTHHTGQLTEYGVPPSGDPGTTRSKKSIAATNQFPKNQSVTGSRIPLNTARQGRTYMESPLTVRGFEETEIRESGYPDLATFLQRRGALR